MLQFKTSHEGKGEIPVPAGYGFIRKLPEFRTWWSAHLRLESNHKDLEGLDQEWVRTLFRNTNIQLYLDREIFWETFPLRSVASNRSAWTCFFSRLVLRQLTLSANALWAPSRLQPALFWARLVSKQKRTNISRDRHFRNDQKTSWQRCCHCY